MSTTLERIRQRRQYLKKKGVAYTRAYLATLLAVPFAVIAIFLVYLAVFLFFTDFPRLFWPSTIMGTVSLFIGAVAWLFARIASTSRQEARQLPYVPPVMNTPLPAREVLLRGSQEPVQEQGQVLLRGVVSRQEGAAQALLRGSSHSGEDQL